MIEVLIYRSPLLCGQQQPITSDDMFRYCKTFYHINQMMKEAGQTKVNKFSNAYSANDISQLCDSYKKIHQQICIWEKQQSQCQQCRSHKVTTLPKTRQIKNFVEKQSKKRNYQFKSCKQNIKVLKKRLQCHRKLTDLASYTHKLICQEGGKCLLPISQVDPSLRQIICKKSKRSACNAFNNNLYNREEYHEDNVQNHEKYQEEHENKQEGHDDYGQYEDEHEHEQEIDSQNDDKEYGKRSESRKKKIRKSRQNQSYIHKKCQKQIQQLKNEVKTLQELVKKLSKEIAQKHETKEQKKQKMQEQL